MRRGIAADAPLSDAGEERLSEEDRRALKMIEELFPGEYRAAKREVAAADADGRGEHAVLQRRQGGRRMVTVRRENTTCDIRGIGAYGIIVAQERNQVMDSGGTPGTNPKKERNRRRRFRDIGRALCRCSIIADRERCVNPSVCCVAGNRIGSQPDDQKAQWNTTAAPLPSSSKQAATTGSRPRGGCLLPFPACAGHGQKARSAQSGTAWPTRMRVDRGSRPTVQIGQHGGIAAKGS